jgi:hypothetical protein
MESRFLPGPHKLKFLILLSPTRILITGDFITFEGIGLCNAPLKM